MRQLVCPCCAYPSLGRDSSRGPVLLGLLPRRPLLLDLADPLGLDDLPAAGNRVSRAG